MSELWFTSDSHFGHEKIISWCQRPFESVEEMNEALIAEWNDRVRPGDTVWHLGDFAMCMTKREVEELLIRLNGNKHLIIGNHDHRQTRNAVGWWQRMGQVVLEIGAETVLLTHRPRESWRKLARWHLHGHSHGGSSEMPGRLDMGVDALGTDHGPVRWQEVLTVLQESELGRNGA